MQHIFKPLPKYTLDFRDKTLDLSTPKVMGVLNVTPDSFSDGGRYNTLDNALTHAREMIAKGADIIDIGGESTRPNADAVDTDEELSRVIPVIEAIRSNLGEDIWLSIDTSNPVVMRESIDAGADIINDVRGLRRTGACQMAASLNCPVIIMHSRGNVDSMSSEMSNLTVYENVVADIKRELGEMIYNAKEAGVKSNNIIIDPGMGFAKDFVGHQVLLSHLTDLIEFFDRPMLFGVSRKRFLGEALTKMDLPYLQNHTATMRDDIGVVAHLFAVLQGASIVRVHDVKAMAQAVKFWQQMVDFNQ